MTEPSQYFKGRTVQEQMNEVIGYVDVRSAEVATDAIASDVAQVHQDMLDADADAAAAAASAAAAAGTLANAVKKTGEASQSIAGDIDLNDDLNVDGDATVGGALTVAGTVSMVDVAVSNKIEVPTPSTNADAAPKKYVDDALDNYGPMVRNTTNNTLTGITFSTLPVLGVNNTSTTEYTKIAYLGSNTQNIYFAGIAAERYNMAMFYFTYVPGTPITNGATVETSAANNISIGVFETSTGELWLANKRLTSGANKCTVSSLICMRGTGSYNPVPSTDGSTFTDADGTYYEAVQI